MTDITLLWHDYETWGINPRRDRPSQFAAIRTNTNLEEIGEPMMFYCRPADDFLPQPEAVLLTGITPQQALAKGHNEAEFFSRINTAFSKPGTCGTGYNTIRFDDEVTRFGFYRNFIDPYAREWQNGNSRWDILDLMRMTHALRPENIIWPKREDGSPSFKLEYLTAANDIDHVGAHDALADVRATIELARLVRRQQPRLYEYYFNLRRKNEVASHLNIWEHTIVLHVSGMYPSSLGCLAPVAPLLQHPRNKNEVIAYDLRHDPHILLNMSADEMAANLYMRKDDMPEGVERIALKGIHLNKSPALAPVNTLNPEMADKWQIDWQQVEKHLEQLLADKTLMQRLEELYLQSPDFKPLDADTALYSGFISNNDRKICNRLLQKTPEQLAGWNPGFDDPRLQTLFPRYRARNWPESLNEDERYQWQEFCKARLLDGESDNTLTLQQYQDILEELSRNISEDQQGLFEQLVQWVQR